MDSPLAAALGGRSAAALRKHLGMDTVGDLLRHLPRKYQLVNDLGAMDPRELREGTYVTVVAEVERVTHQRRPRRGGRGLLDITSMQISVGSIELGVTFFNQPWRHLQMPRGSRAMFAGKLQRFRGGWQLDTPQARKIRADGEDDDGGGEESLKLPPVTPIYPATRNVQTWDLLAAVRQTLDVFDDPVDPVPEEIRRRHGLVGLGRALRDIHLPATLEDTKPAMRRLTWDEALALQLVLQGEKLAASDRPAPSCPRTADGLAAAFDARLPFALTAGQQKVGADLAESLAGTRPLNRLLQGDVGSGKTVVALRAMLQVVDAGRQAVLLAPTEVLAAQHARSLRAMLGPLGRAGEPAALFDDAADALPEPVELDTSDRATRVVLLTGSLSAKDRRAALLDVQSGAAGIVVGTHAVIQEGVGFADLGLVVVDEQHRFGVRQRDELRSRTGDTVPHLLVMTATPIPRTVALTLYGDLDVSVLDELPAGRQPIGTRAVPGGLPKWLARVWERVREEVDAGHQAYVVCPRIGDDEPADPGDQADGSASPDDAADGEERRPPLGVLEVAELLVAGPLAGLRVEILHGRLPAEEKDDVMRRFGAGDIDVLVATTVVEVGVDVPNATAIVVLDAERFGVSQLHQLRGRVGRGTSPASCFLVTDAAPGSPAMTRLERIAEISDGFAMADLDLELRSEGDVLGTEQAGRMSTLRFLSVRRHGEEIAEAREVARTVLEEDPALARHPRLVGLVRAVVGDEGARFLDRL
ncbi:ATP-dependent DNA helicase RecG [Actinomycetospora sp. TBRC 11914]|uniref:ATP-dependent DNA helicase RecG n=1 Tax=Actinomycetospora sp. TBRC 11914 TaxID=2729387 RepID=UPI00145DF06C|nr:ATP-dependent DNA helicase RecG [Actinomycetospora sp. TBRC 11914]NMO91141.1 ATP-dependent DNA helicase RecG [Actinomycetospora sp. TBRC 11914]